MTDQQILLTPEKMDEFIRQQNALLKQQRDMLRRSEQKDQEHQYFLIHGRRRAPKGLPELVGQMFADSFVTIGKGLLRMTLETLELALDRLCEKRQKQRGQ